MDIYVGNLSYDTTDADLQQLFEQHGKVTSARVIMDKMTGRAKGFGFVEMPERTEAETAINSINGSDFMGRPVRVNESQPRESGGGGHRSGGGGGGGGGGGKRW